MAVQKYNGFLEISPTFESVVDIDADKRNANLWREYIVGDDMEKLVEFLCQSLGNEAPDSRRSFWIHGSYGTGKSYAAIFVKHLLEEKPEVVDAFLSSSSRLSQFRNRFMKCRKNGDYLVIWKTGCTGIRSGDMMLLEAEQAIRDAIVGKFGEKAYLGTSSLTNAVRNKLNDPSINWEHVLETTTLEDDYNSVEELRGMVEAGDLTAIQETAAVIRQLGFGLINNLETFKAWISDVIDGNGLSKSGIFFIWDEFTEYVAHSDDHTVMQQISEFCKEKPLFMLYVVHRSQDMVDTMGKERYQTITHRFHEVEFHISADAAYDLIAGSINTRVGMNENWKDARKGPIRNIRPFLPDMSGLDDKISEQIANLCPMHPMTIKLLARVAESYAAAERTMFRFMKDQSNAELGFVGYINRYGPSDQACWLTPDWLWDYFFTRESDFSDKDTKAADYIHHYEENRNLVDSDENASRVFKTAMLLLAVMSSTKGVYGGKKAQGGISATVDCLKTCLAGVVAGTQVDDLLATFEEDKILLRDEATNGVVRLQLPFKGGGDDFDARYEKNDKKYTRYQMFVKDGILSTAFEAQAWNENDAMYKRMKIAVCCAETNSIKARQEEIQKDLDKNPYKLGLLIVTVQDDAQYMAVQSDLASRAAASDDSRLTIALVKNPFTDEKRKQWLTSLTKQEMAADNGQTASVGQYKTEAMTIISTWVSAATSGSKIIAWNGTQFFSNLYGMANLQKTIQTAVRDVLFPYAPETIVITSTAYKTCTDAAVSAGITRTTNNSQLKSVISGLENAKLLNLTSIDDMAQATGSKEAASISELARLVREEMDSGQKVVLSDLWAKLQEPPFGYYNTIACGVILGYVFSHYKDSAFSWTDNAQSTHSLAEATLKTVILNMCKSTMTTDYLSAGTVTFQNFRGYAQKIMNLSDAQIANETECWHSMREAITLTGVPIWALKYLSIEEYGSEDLRKAASEIVDNIQEFIALDSDRESAMSNVIQSFNGRGKLRKMLEKDFQDKNVMAAAFRNFLFTKSPELENIAQSLMIQPQDLSDKLHMIMQGAIYTWTEEQVEEKLGDVVSEYNFLATLNDVIGSVFHSIEEAKKELSNLFKHQRIAMAAIERLNKPWNVAYRVLHQVSEGDTARMTPGNRYEYSHALKQYGSEAMACLQDGKPILSDILEAQGLECTQEELDSIFAGLKEMTSDTKLAQFDKELKQQIANISQSRNRVLLQERWFNASGTKTVRDWCSTYGVPILWIMDKETQKAILTVIDVQKGNRTLDTNVQKAIAILEQMDTSILTQKTKISAAFLQTVGQEFNTIPDEELAMIIKQAKLKIGNDMSEWDTSDLATLQKILKHAIQEKAKKEQLEKIKVSVNSMHEQTLRNKVNAFLDAHPEYCDNFSEA